MNEKSILLADDLASISDIDRSQSHLLRDLAAELGRRLNCPLRILYVANSQKHFFTKEQSNRLKLKDKEALSLLEKEMSHYSVKTKIISMEGEPVSTILKQQAKGESLEMLVVGSHGKRGLQKAIIGSVSEEVLRHSLAPVLVLGPEARNNKFELPMEDPLRILLLTDLSPASKNAEEYAFSIASRVKARLTICHSVGHKIHQLKEMLASRGIGNLSMKSMLKEMSADSDKLITKRVKQAEKRNINVDGLLIKDESKLEDIVPKCVGDGYDLIIMGTNSRNKILTAFLGSSARNLILKAPIPVIVCRTVEL